MAFDISTAGLLAVAALAGMAVGLEREWSGHTRGPDPRFAGVRTFFLLGTLGGLAGWLIGGGYPMPGLVLLAAAAALTVAAYVVVARQGGEAVDGTTEVAAVLVLLIGVISGLGFPLVTSGVAAIMVLVLAEKTRIHRAISRLGEPELTAALQFAVLALVVLPLLPEGPFDPFQSVRPRALWTVVLLFSGLNFAGYLARRSLGEHRGYTISGLLGGLVSSTAVTLQFSRRSREAPAAAWPLALGVVGACTVLLLRTSAIFAVLSGPTALALAKLILLPLLCGIILVGFGFFRRPKDSAESEESVTSPLGLGASLKMAALFQLVLTVIALVRQSNQPTTLLSTAAVLGLTDVDALTYAMARTANESGIVELAARGVAIGVLSNTVLKLGLVLILGRGHFRRLAAGGLLILGLASGAALWLAS